MRKIVLSVDGGGIKGIIPATILWRLEQDGIELKEVDLFSGVSTGAIISGMLAKGYTAKEVLNFYFEKCSVIFKQDWVRSLRSVFNTSLPKYSNDGMLKVAAEVFGDTTFEDLKTQLLVTTYDISTPNAVHLTNTTHSSWKLSDAVVASASAPTFFPPFKRGENYFIDGSWCNTNPTLSAFVEANTLWPEDDIYTLSLGCGDPGFSIDGRKAVGWGTINWLPNLVPSMFDAVESDSSLNLDVLLSSLKEDNHFLRIQIPGKYNLGPIDKIDRSHLEDLKSIGERIYEERKQEFHNLFQ